MTKLIRFDEDHFGYLIDRGLTQALAHDMATLFAEKWPGKHLIIMQADEFIDLTGEYEIVPITTEAAS